MTRRICLLILCLLPSSLLQADDYQDLQGVWERKFLQNDRQFHVRKKIEGNQETVTVTHQGTIVQKHVVKFELSTEGPVKIFRWKKGRITEGNNAGKALTDGQMIYRLDGPLWFSVQGFLVDDQGAPTTEVYRRTGDAPVDQPS